MDLTRPGDLADLPGDLLAQFVDHIGTAAVGVGGEHDERADALASGLVTCAHDAGFGHPGTRYQRQSHLRRPDPMPRDIHDTVDATKQPDRAAGVDPGAVTREIPAPF